MKPMILTLRNLNEDRGSRRIPTRWVRDAPDGCFTMRFRMELGTASAYIKVRSPALRTSRATGVLGRHRGEERPPSTPSDRGDRSPDRWFRSAIPAGSAGAGP